MHDSVMFAVGSLKCWLVRCRSKVRIARRLWPWY